MNELITLLTSTWACIALCLSVMTNIFFLGILNIAENERYDKSCLTYFV